MSPMNSLYVAHPSYANRLVSINRHVLAVRREVFDLSEFCLPYWFSRWKGDVILADLRSPPGQGHVVLRSFGLDGATIRVEM